MRVALSKDVGGAPFASAQHVGGGGGGPYSHEQVYVVGLHGKLLDGDGDICTIGLLLAGGKPKK